MAAIGAALLSAALSITGKLLTQKMFEVLMVRLLVATLDKIKDSTSNTLDDEMVADIKKRLGGVVNESG